MKNKVKILREQKNLTQAELAENSGLSLRTIQRIESGSVMKGFTLKAVAKALHSEPEELFFSEEKSMNVDRAKLINFSALCGLIIPFGGVIFPLILTLKTKDDTNKMLGKEIVSFQIVLAVFTSVLLIVTPFVQKFLSIKFPLFIVVLVLFISIKLLVILKNGVSLGKNGSLVIRLKNSIL